MKFKHLSIRLIFFILLAPSLLFSRQTFSKDSSPPQPVRTFTENEVIVEVANSADAAELAREKNLTVIPLGQSGKEENFYLAESTAGKSTQKLIRELRQNPLVRSVQKNFRYQSLTRAPNDPKISEGWALFDTASAGGGVSAFFAWDLETKKGQRNIAIAVIDTGANLKHKDLKDNLTKGSAKGKNFEYPKKKPTDSDGHGTFLAGIIAAETNNKRGIAGASFWNHLRVMPLRFDFTTSQAITAINYAKAKSVPVVNASWGSYGDEGLDPALEISIAAYPGIFVTASGNNGYNHDGGDLAKKMYPCDFNLPNIICTGATDRAGNLADYSDYGAASVDVGAPGGTDADDLIGLDKRKSNYSRAEGSSLSAAFVSAEAGLIISKYPNLSSSQIIEIIKNSVDTNASLAEKVSSGGKVNFQKALQLAANY